MGVNVRTKGQSGEREVAKLLNAIIADVRAEKGLTPLEIRDEIFQRNQNQSAVGGADLSNPMGLEIEVKRQESLSVNSWWTQTVDSAARTGGIPILIYRQNRKKWRVMMLVNIPVPMDVPNYSSYSSLSNCRAEFDLDTFKQWFKAYAANWVK